MNKKELFTTILVFLFISIAINLVLVKTNVIKYNNIFIDGQEVEIEIMDELENIYNDTLEYEIPVCLAGEVTDNGISIRAMIEAEIVSTSLHNVTYVSCPLYIGSQRVIGTIHNHPSGECRLSNQDIETYVNDMSRGQEVIGLYCGEYVFFILSRLEGVIPE